jgi:small-conductance mechanosensitive channel
MSTSKSSQAVEPLYKRLLVPFTLSLVLGVIILYGGEAYQATGLAALENSLTILGYVLGIAEFFVLAILVQRVFQHVILDRIVAAALGTPTPRLLTQLSAFIIYALAVGAIVGVVFKKDLTVILTAFGGAGIVIGLALQNVIFDLFAGLIINLDRSIKMGDFIRFTQDLNVQGEVEEISWRTMRILDTECNVIIVPNSRVFSSIVTNYSQPKAFIEIDVVITLDAEVPVERALRILLSAAIEAAPHCSIPDSPPPNVKIKAITLQGIEYVVQIYPSFKTRAKGRNFLQQQIMRHLNFAGITPARAKLDNYQDNSQAIDYVHFNRNHLATLLGSLNLFQDLAPAELELLASSGLIRQLAENTRLVQGGEIATSMFLVIEGLLVAEEWRKKLGKKATAPVVENILGPGYLMSSDVMLAGGSYEFTVRSKGTVLLYEIDYRVIEKLFIQKPEAAYCLSQRVANNISTHSEQAIEMTVIVFRNLQRSFAHLKLPYKDGGVC